MNGLMSYSICGRCCFVSAAQRNELFCFFVLVFFLVFSLTVIQVHAG